MPATRAVPHRGDAGWGGADVSPTGARPTIERRGVSGTRGGTPGAFAAGGAAGVRLSASGLFGVNFAGGALTTAGLNTATEASDATADAVGATTDVGDVTAGVRAGARASVVTDVGVGGMRRVPGGGLGAGMGLKTGDALRIGTAASAGGAACSGGFFARICSADCDNARMSSGLKWSSRVSSLKAASKPSDTSAGVFIMRAQ